MTPKVTIDFETYSEAGYTLLNGKVTGEGLSRVGVPAYAEHPSTDVLCLAYDLENEIRLWVPHLSAPPKDLFRWVELGGAVEAHNIPFERWIWNSVCRKKYGFLPLPLEQQYCSLAKCRRFGVPPSLDEAAAVLGGEQKDKRGKQLIQLLCRPNSWTKTRPYYRRQPWDHWDLYLELYEYCKQDVRTEKSVSLKVPDLTEYERRVWLTDQRINDRGVQIDTETLASSLSILSEFKPQANHRMAIATEGRVLSTDQSIAIAKWLTDNGAPTDSIKEEALTRLLEKDDLPEKCREVIKIRQSVAGANIRKLYTIRDQVSSDGRLRHQYVYCGADQTGRWSSGGAQLQNLTSQGPKSYRCTHCGRVQGHADTCRECGAEDLTPQDWDDVAVTQAVTDIRSGDIWKFWPDIVDTMTGCLRALFIAKPGYKLVCCDFSSVEAMAAAELSGCPWRKEVFRTHGNIYAASASQATGTPLSEILDYKKQHGKHHPLRNGIGKVRELAGGYGGWIGAWKNFGADKYFNSDNEVKRDVLRWREKSPEIVEMWGGQFRQTGPRLSDGHPELYGLEGAAIWAIQNPNRSAHYRQIGYLYDGGSLHCQLPSGRLIRYHRPKLIIQPGEWGRPPEYKITFWGFNTSTLKGKRGWICMETYGGRMFENTDQGTCGDIQAEALVRMEQEGWRPVMHTHDEGVAEVPVDGPDHTQLKQLFEVRPSWCRSWPIRADGWSGPRYKK